MATPVPSLPPRTSAKPPTRPRPRYPSPRSGPLAVVLSARPFVSSDVAFEAKLNVRASAAIHALNAAALARYTRAHFAGTTFVAKQARNFERAPRALLLDVERGGVRFSWATDAACDQLPEGGRVAIADLPAALARACGG